MKTCIKKIGNKTAIGAMLLLVGMIWRGRKLRLQWEIDVFDLIMKELKADRIRRREYYEKGARNGKEVTECCQIK